MEETVQSLAAKPEPFIRNCMLMRYTAPYSPDPDLKEPHQTSEAKNSKQANWLVSLQEWMSGKTAQFTERPRP